jgi:hypothetical protein
VCICVCGSTGSADDLIYLDCEGDGGTAEGALLLSTPLPALSVPCLAAADFCQPSRNGSLLAIDQTLDPPGQFSKNWCPPHPTSQISKSFFACISGAGAYCTSKGLEKINIPAPWHLPILAKSSSLSHNLHFLAPNQNGQFPNAKSD